jgi:fumarate reductase subunit D
MKKKILFCGISLVTLFCVPFGTYAVSTVTIYESSILTFLKSLVSLLISGAVIFFFWGLMKFVQASEDSDARAEAKGLMIYGVISIFVMVSIWGFIALLSSTFNLNNTTGSINGLIP